jgi:hypothetical protein
MVGHYEKLVLDYKRNAQSEDANNSAWRDEQVRTMRELRSLQDENTLLKGEKFSLEIQLKRKSAATLKTNGFLNRKSEADWKKEWSRLEVINDERFQNEMRWYSEKAHVFELINTLKQRNAELRTEIKSLKDKLEMLTTSTPVSTNLYLVRNSY